MSDELECFRRAAELGCPDFYDTGNRVMFRGTTQYSYALPCVTEGEFTDRKINRYAAAVCEIWWSERVNNILAAAYWNETDSQIQAVDEGEEMIDLARAFGRKYGEAKA